jgi:hypothetical protein
MRKRPTIERLESRRLCADGIAPMAGPPLSATAGVPLVGVEVASFTVTDPAATSNMDWRALINWGDGRPSDILIAPNLGPQGTFVFAGTHTYMAAGRYTVTVMIAVPGSGKPNDNTVTVPVVVAGASSTPTGVPVVALDLSARTAHRFRGSVGTFEEAGGRSGDFHASIDWGDGSPASTGRIKNLGGGRFGIGGTHLFHQSGTFRLTVTVTDSAGRQGLASASETVRAGGRR